ncbi:NAD-dependent epimerase/dehydratase family protein [Demequina sp. SYSU T00039]|uniref:NAD-dependent epimerase/dehydratase family protein n=1 Tax=Demequina lignilytica TaxID=3051663 RepID=A0AAW7M2S4_9MICO|nr:MULTISPECIES: NAD-dependent epimerase/dehydratase family protein [unclassified Demequina]MDN4477753.1 NAD-dependent epimerase/dehydratase family protein [Demequina sp. SYSU T00039-1]MDN4487662.1 NAD-dependent epimerase/dehydratase family protein [Demequina sp. SYSU T00039]MDN4491373.1 NAD-dependent epimerase/dehydratase family protein [Demequina sp. SYSU T00068]
MSTVYDAGVVGSAGFLGGAILRDLRARGLRVSGFTRDHPVLEAGALAAEAASARVLVWAAGGVGPAVAHERPDLVERELETFDTFVAAAMDRDLPPRIVLLSSGGAVYGHPELPPYREDGPVHPSNAYGALKLEQERILARAHAPSTSLRLSNVYGPGQSGANGQGVLAIWMRAVLAGAPVRIVGDGEVERDYVHIDDVTEAVARVAERPDAPAVLNIGSGRPTHLIDLLELVEYVVGPERVTVERLPGRAADAASTWLDVSLAHEALDWQASVPLAEGIASQWAWMRDA